MDYFFIFRYFYRALLSIYRNLLLNRFIKVEQESIVKLIKNGIEIQ